MNANETDALGDHGRLTLSRFVAWVRRRRAAREHFLDLMTEPNEALPRYLK
jgi:hypothetical protein